MTDQLRAGGAAVEDSGPRPGRRRGRLGAVGAQDLFVPVTVLVLVAALSLLTDVFFTSNNLLNVMTQMATLAIVSFGVTVVMIGGAFDLSVGAQVAVHGSISALVMAATGSVWAGVAAGLASGAVFGAVNGLLVTGLSINPFIVTLGTLVIGRGFALAITGARPVAGLPEGIRDFGLGSALGVPWLVWLMLACFAVATFVLHVSPFGLRIFAIGGSREAARLSGIRVNRDTVLAFVISGMFAAIAGMALTARLRSGQPNAGQLLELFAVAAVVLGGSSLYGGRGAVWRTMLGVALIAIIGNGLNLLNVSTPFQEMIIGAVFIVAASSEVLRSRSARGGR
ncbi:sugar ABC transporter permease [soil metagenome]|jgi:ribose transport system permease protein|nr:ABC transporter permease [Euzebyaceae bacterium]